MISQKGKPMTVKWIAALAATAMFWPVMAHADDTDNDADLKCMILGVELAASPDPQLQGPGQLTALYFMGRLNGRAPSQDLQAKIIAQAKAMSPGDISTAAQACSTTLAAAGKSLADISQAMAKDDAAPKD